MESNGSEDASLWDEERVVFEVCTRPDSAFAKVPKRSQLEQTLRDNNIDGECLLELNLEILKNDLGITSFGQRATILKAIKTLRPDPSTEEKVSRLQDGHQTPQILQPGSSLSVQSRPYSPLEAMSTIEQDIAQRQSLPQIPHRPNSTFVQFPGYRQDASASPKDTNTILGQGTALLSGSSAPPYPFHASTSSSAQVSCPKPSQVNENVPPRLSTERHIETPIDQSASAADVHIRALAPNVAAHVAANTPFKEPLKGVATSQVSHGQLQEYRYYLKELQKLESSGLMHRSSVPLATENHAKISNTTISKRSKRVAPTLIRSLESEEIDLTVFHDGAYYGPESIPIQDIFYPPNAADSGKDFQMVPPKRPTGVRRAIASLMRHYFRQPTVPLPDTPFMYRMPYKAERCVGPNSRHLFSLFLRGGVHRVEPVDEWSAQLSGRSSENTLPKLAENDRFGPASPQALSPGKFDTPLRSNAEQQEAIPGFDDFEYLLDKYRPRSDDDEVLPLYGDSGDENEFDDETWEEIEAEQAERTQASNTVSKQEVISTIDDTIRDFEKFWQERKFPKVQAKTYSIWTKAMTLNIRQAQREATTRILHRCERRFRSLKDAVLDEPWQRASDIRFQCQSMEETFFCILECRHILQALDSKMAPEKPNKETVKRMPKVKVQLPEGEEILDSDDDMDDFLADDSSMAEDIPFAAEEEDDLNPEFEDPTPGGLPPPAKVVDLAPAEETRSPARNKNVEAPGDEADVESDEDDQVLTPLNKRRRYAKPLTPRKPKERAIEPGKSIHLSDSDSDNKPVVVDATLKGSQSACSFPGQSAPQTIDLTMSDPPEPAPDASSSEFDVRTPPLNPEINSPDAFSTPGNSAQQPWKDPSVNASRPRTPVCNSEANTQQLPRHEDVPEIRRLAWETITNKSDRMRALYKAVYNLRETEFRNLCTYLDKISKRSKPKEEILKKNLPSLKDLCNGGQRSNKTARPKKLLAMLFVTYVCSKQFSSIEGGSPLDLDKSYEKVAEGSKKFFNCLDAAVKAYSAFLEDKNGSLKRKAQEISDGEGNSEDESSDGAATDNESHLPQSARKRRRKIAESQEAKAHQKTDQQRVLEQEQRRKAMEKKFAAILSNSKAQHFINTVEPFVPLDPHIAARVKPHQIEGIRFLWREIIEDPKHQGCLLAHTMGLGKTMQVISLLVSIAQCNRSDDVRMRSHIPLHLRQIQTLILCPPSLLDNWYDEIVMWLPADCPNLLGALYKIRSSEDRASIEAWASGGGIMIISYDLFRSMLTSRKDKQNTEMVDDDLAYRQKLFLEKANLVVADEAHKMKNANSAISQLARKIRTRSRIALTGSPLNNHLEEYHTMVNWIFPGYLGEMVQFRAKYVEPIHAGLYAESTSRERRVCLKKLHVLKQDLAPKVNRADITAISKDLPTKTEYVITLPLTELQRQAYDTYARYMLQAYSSTGNLNGNGLFSLISILVSLCNHPWILVKKKFTKRSNPQAVLGQGLFQESGKESGPSSGPDDSDVANSPEGEAEAEAGALPDLDAASPTEADIVAMEEAVAVFRETENLGRLQDPGLSYRAAVVQQILEKSIARGDKVLVFSHSPDTLDYLGILLDQMRCHYLRVDGKTQMRRRQDISKLFNSDDTYSVCLISTRAGGLGLNFQGANRVIIYDSGFNPMWEEQAVGRAYRLGQKRPVHVYRFKIGGTVEEVISNKAIFKTQLFSRVVDKKNPMRQASKKASDYLFLAREVEQQDFEECVGKDPGVLDAIIEEGDQIRNIELTETFHKEDNEQLNDQELKEAEEEYDRQRLLRDDPVAYQKKYGHEAQLRELQQFQQRTPRPYGPGVVDRAYHDPNKVASRTSSTGKRQAPAHSAASTGTTTCSTTYAAPKSFLIPVGMSQQIPGLQNSVLEVIAPANKANVVPASEPLVPVSSNAPAPASTAKSSKNSQIDGAGIETNGMTLPSLTLNRGIDAQSERPTTDLDTTVNVSTPGNGPKDTNDNGDSDTVAANPNSHETDATGRSLPGCQNQ